MTLVKVLNNLSIQIIRRRFGNSPLLVSGPAISCEMSHSEEWSLTLYSRLTGKLPSSANSRDAYHVIYFLALAGTLIPHCEEPRCSGCGSFSKAVIRSSGYVSFRNQRSLVTPLHPTQGSQLCDRQSGQSHYSWASLLYKRLGTRTLFCLESMPPNRCAKVFIEHATGNGRSTIPCAINAYEAVGMSNCRSELPADQSGPMLWAARGGSASDPSRLSLNMRHNKSDSTLHCIAPTSSG
ncbi:uncharacterized protein EV422DRAFT_512399 [Fimicolochytrium jonesii]|uniref:uncharacterized protein n=1 Tax=Fimicolochytrium jonesii TaxID=1396493 RepID=UPI0022FE6706|nr:uncharacterized protein EV422DRAFT_512399 [Fimicolochytrium jonesii]KAI8827031.1 hypothetical protein EV422DRAFT_512399 [Fimicolochytrium jonesii]